MGTDDVRRHPGDERLLHDRQPQLHDAGRADAHGGVSAAGGFAGGEPRRESVVLLERRGLAK
jgi:hypothetical protein